MQDNNGAFVDTIEAINRIAKGKGFVNGAAWAQAAADKGQMTQDEYNRYRDLHTMRIRYAHGNARDIYISDETLEEARMYLARIQGKKYEPKAASHPEEPRREEPRREEPRREEPRREEPRREEPRREEPRREEPHREEPTPRVREEAPTPKKAPSKEPKREAPAQPLDNPWRRSAAPTRAAARPEAPAKAAAADPIDNPWRRAAGTATAPREDATPARAPSMTRPAATRENPWRAMTAAAPQRVELSRYGERIVKEISRYRRPFDHSRGGNAGTL